MSTNSGDPRTLPSLPSHVTSIETALGFDNKVLPVGPGSLPTNCVSLTIDDSHELVKLTCKDDVSYSLHSFPAGSGVEELFNWPTEIAVELARKAV